MNDKLNQLVNFETQLNDYTHLLRKGIASCWLDMYHENVIGISSKQKLNDAIISMQKFLIELENSFETK